MKLSQLPIRQVFSINGVIYWVDENGHTSNSRRCGHVYNSEYGARVTFFYLSLDSEVQEVNNVTVKSE